MGKKVKYNVGQVWLSSSNFVSLLLESNLYWQLYNVPDKLWPIWIKREDHDGNYFKLSTGHASKRHRQPRCHKMEHLLVYSPYMAHQLRFISFLLALGTVVFTPVERSNKHLLLTHVWNSVIKFMMISQSMIVKALFFNNFAFADKSQM